jgi:hypothetical protein
VNDIPDLWPEQFNLAVRSPLAILEAQAEKLSGKTGGLLQSEVTTTREGEEVTHSLDIIAPDLNDDHHTLVTVTVTPPHMYPAQVCCVLTDETNEADDEKALLRLLGQALRSTEVGDLVSHLAANVKEKARLAENQ